MLITCNTEKIYAPFSSKRVIGRIKWGGVKNVPQIQGGGRNREDVSDKIRDERQEGAGAWGHVGPTQDLSSQHLQLNGPKSPFGLSSFEFVTLSPGPWILERGR